MKFAMGKCGYIKLNQFIQCIFIYKKEKIILSEYGHVQEINSVYPFSFPRRIRKFEFEYIKNKIENGFDLFSDSDRMWKPIDTTANINRVFSRYLEKWFQLKCPTYLATMVYHQTFCYLSKDFLKIK
jgi:hypothetical protein